jgi:hypothetical protein
MDLNDWILSLHLLSAFAVVAAEVLFSILIVWLWRSDSTSRVASTMPMARVGGVLVMAGMAGTIVFGVWLAISLDAYQVWDGWVIAAIVMWLAWAALGRKSGDGYNESGELAGRLHAEGKESSTEIAETFGPSTAFWAHVATVVLVVLILLDMIWKPGA